MKGLGSAVAAAAALRLSGPQADLWFRWLMEESAKMNVTTNAANLPCNKHLNRWHNVLPVDSTRVILSPKVRPETDYINANHVVVPEAQRAYILSQGPLDETVADFWAMVWQQNCRAIVMLCKTVEGGMCKCAHYWPVNPSHASNSSAKPLRLEEIGLEIRLLKTKEDEGADARIRTMEITQIDSGGGASEQRTLVQYHFQSWPDFGVPSTPNAFLEFLHLVNRDHPSLPGSPSVVHCSAGIGRSGTFCLVDSCIEVARSGEALNLTQKEVLQMLHRMRRQRDGQVQTSDQLRFALNAIAEAMVSLDVDQDQVEKEIVTASPTGSAEEEAAHEDEIEHDSERSVSPEPTPASEVSTTKQVNGGGTSNGVATPGTSRRDSRKRNSLNPDDQAAEVGANVGGEGEEEEEEVKPTSEKQRKKEC